MRRVCAGTAREKFNIVCVFVVVVVLGKQQAKLSYAIFINEPQVDIAEVGAVPVEIGGQEFILAGADVGNCRKILGFKQDVVAKGAVANFQQQIAMCFEWGDSDCGMFFDLDLCRRNDGVVWQ